MSIEDIAIDDTDTAPPLILLVSTTNWTEAATLQIHHTRMILVMNPGRQLAGELYPDIHQLQCIALDHAMGYPQILARIEYLLSGSGVAHKFRILHHPTIGETRAMHHDRIWQEPCEAVTTYRVSSGRSGPGAPHVANSTGITENRETENILNGRLHTEYSVQRWSFLLTISSVISHLGAIGSELDLSVKGGSRLSQLDEWPLLSHPSSCALVTPYGAAFVCVSWPLKEMGLFKKYGIDGDNNSRSGFRVLFAARDIEEPALTMEQAEALVDYEVPPGNIPIMTRRLAAIQIQYDYTKLCHDQKAFYQKEGIIKMSS
ncbi:hypothetical protein PCH_Pc22g17590 [Penicillium rubens Wisconsin 54-1255]|uniref:Uncharacterized protein n=1 Tax=Penicillium rubens (strain ATCC 28089 / DSM 1075 / NRRL 1951 / Wisconsin 54-1255) TaxID=500485 RepID=B6HT83_PENRW|nr:hypothetical protein PCH_Pc22g17590 [Penicillium rubens Wisconsin 54-1255]